MSDDLSGLVADLHDHLKATEELPIDHRANRWIAEAEAVVADLVGEDVSSDVLARRIGHVRDLLERMDDPDNEAARERVAAALSVVERIESRVDAGDDGTG